jgi:hypothetical protein
MDDEPHLWFQRFDAYRLLGPSRALIDALNNEKDAKGRERAQRAPGSWRRIATIWQWSIRAEAWDEVERKRVEAEWEQRRFEQREREWRLGTKMQERAMQALEIGIVYDDDDGIMGVKLPDLKASDIPKMADTGSKLARLATGEPTAHVQVDDAASARERLAGLLNRLAATDAAPDDPGEP